MQAYIEAIDLLMCKVVKNDLVVLIRAPTQVVQQESNDQPTAVATAATAAARLEELKADKHKTPKQSICFTALFLLLSLTEFPRVTAKAIWDRLQVMFKGTDRVRKTKTKILLGNYEMFEMKSDEGIVVRLSSYTRN